MWKNSTKIGSFKGIGWGGKNIKRYKKPARFSRPGRFVIFDKITMTIYIYVLGLGEKLRLHAGDNFDRICCW